MNNGLQPTSPTSKKIDWLGPQRAGAENEQHNSRIHPDGVTTSYAWDPHHRCTLCTAEFDSNRNLDNHTASVHGCPQCGKKLKSSDTLRAHQATVHQGFLCPGCSNNFATKISLSPSTLSKQRKSPPAPKTGSACYSPPGGYYSPHILVTSSPSQTA